MSGWSNFDGKYIGNFQQYQQFDSQRASSTTSDTPTTLGEIKNEKLQKCLSRCENMVLTKEDVDVTHGLWSQILPLLGTPPTAAADPVELDAYLSMFLTGEGHIIKNKLNLRFERTNSFEINFGPIIQKIGLLWCISNVNTALVPTFFCIAISSQYILNCAAKCSTQTRPEPTTS
ncbi:unnamed protein product [Didymodactylos carnosus]|uniref:Uncharacterized protein n=2 Tax=Didymodactylos carnosus TaxID=1234261 RepID=A0A815X096_9BILA|nr:unnamed protein product [Didymodactylos carnosus]CAF4409579.1 unnamed protein product [Didymodactylos carnosus]